MKNETIAAALAFVMLCVLVLFGDAYGGSGTADAETVWTAEITLTGDTAEWTGDGVTLEDGVLTLGGSGTYRLTGTWQEGRIVVEAGKKGYVTLVLDGLDVTSSTGSALEIASCSRVTVLTAEGSENRLKSTAQGDDAASALVTKADLLLDGAGSLTLVSAGKHGVQAADSLTVSGGTLAIEAAKAGLRANDFIRITGGGISVTAGEDGLHADGDESKPDTGWIEIAGGSLVICAGDDGVHAETKLTVSGGSLTVTESYEGLEAEEIVILGGDIDVTAEDDGMNAAAAGSSAEPDFAGGERAGMPEGAKPPEGMEPPEGVEPAEGMEPPEGMDFPQGAGPEKGGQPGDFAPGEGAKETDSTSAAPALLRISGGTVRVHAGGDGLDSNGDLVIEGGTVVVDGPSESMNGALDSGSENGGSLIVSGGTVLAVGASGMDECFGEDSAQVSFRYAGLAFEAGDVIRVSLSDGTVLFEHTAKDSGDSVVFSSPELEEGQTVILQVGEEETEIQLTGRATSAGQSAGFAGRMGRHR
ncbi:MAG: carbohydrate-binding domain-containing protein [Clostridia bacterium]|nr:carbohydrate-binding domain-containing protein [Clostridia bacterium]